MFDTFAGLPVHALVVHGAVVLLPLMAVVTCVIVVRPSWRTRSALVATVVADAAVVIMCFVAKESGEKLQDRLSQAAGHEVAEDHAELGDVLPLFALALLIVVVVILVLVHRGASTVLVNVTVALTVAIAIASVGWTVAVGHSGAESVWKDQVVGSSPASDGD